MRPWSHDELRLHAGATSRWPQETHHFLPIVAVLILLVVFPVPLAIALTATFAVNVLVQSRSVGSLPVCLWAVHSCAALAALSAAHAPGLRRERGLRVQGPLPRKLPSGEGAAVQ